MPQRIFVNIYLDPFLRQSYISVMPKRSSKRKKRPDVNELATAITSEATDPETAEEAVQKEQPDTEGKNPAAVALGRLGGLKGGKARAKKLTKQQRSEAARKAALARWKKKEK